MEVITKLVLNEDEHTVLMMALDYQIEEYEKKLEGVRELEFLGQEDVKRELEDKWIKRIQDAKVVRSKSHHAWKLAVNKTYK